jgi:hypothetical protein
MKKLFTFFCFFALISSTFAQQAGDYFPSSTGFGWKFKVTPLDSASNPANNLAEFRIDTYATVGDYKGKLANIVTTKTGPLQTIQTQPFSDSLFYNTNGTEGFEYLSTKNIEPFLITLDEKGVIPNFSFVDFFTSLQSWYSTYRFTSIENTEYSILQRDTTILLTISGFPFNVPIQFKYLGTRLQDQTIQTDLGNYDCKKFLLQWKVATTFFNLGDLITLNDTIWVAPGNWIVQDIMPGQYVNNLTALGIDPFSIPGLEIKLTNEIPTAVENEKSTPIAFSLKQNYPNPFNPSTKISYTVPERSNVSLKVFNLLGSEIAELVNGEIEAGTYKVNFNAVNLPSGVYLYQLKAGEFTQTKKMILLK